MNLRPRNHTDVLLDVVVPVFNEEPNLVPLVEELSSLRRAVAARCAVRVTFVDDASSDGSAEKLRAIVSEHNWCRFTRLGNNRGSHVAILAGLATATGDCAAFLAADMQDPGSMLAEMLKTWQAGYDVVWAARRDKEASSSRLEAAFSAVFWSIFTRLSGFHFPPQGVDFGLLDASVVRSLLQSMTVNSNIVAEISMVSTAQTCLFYNKRKRLHGASKWTLRKKLEACVDALAGYSYAPIRLMTYIGLGIAACGLFYTATILIRASLNAALPLGWPTLMASLFLLGGAVMVMLGIIGEYAWRILEVARRRPLYTVAECLPDENCATENPCNGVNNGATHPGRAPGQPHSQRETRA